TKRDWSSDVCSSDLPVPAPVTTFEPRVLLSINKVGKLGLPEILHAVEGGALHPVSGDDAHREPLETERIGPRPSDRVVGNHDVAGMEHADCGQEIEANERSRCDDRVALHPGTVDPLGVRLQVNAREGRSRLKLIVTHNWADTPGHKDALPAG